jgi:hypothetical protein
VRAQNGYQTEATGPKFIILEGQYLITECYVNLRLAFGRFSLPSEAGMDVIGDVHGCLAELTSLFEALPLVRGDIVVFLGDYSDWGPDSREVVDYLLTIREGGKQERVFLRRNH